MKVLEPSLTDEDLVRLERDTFKFFADEVNLENGLVRDSTRRGSPASIAAVGFALTAYTIAVERKFMRRVEAVKRTLTTLRFFHDAPHGEQRDATGYKGFYYHFLDMETGRRAGDCELSTIDTTYLLAGALTAACYFDADTKAEREVRALAETLYNRADWHWAQNGALTVSHGWRPEHGFIRYRWTGYSEALILYFLGLASPTFPLPRKLQSMDQDLQVEKTLRSRVSLRRAAIHSSLVAHVDRLSRHPGRLHARQGDQLFREQPSRDLCAAGVRDA